MTSRIRHCVKNISWRQKHLMMSNVRHDVKNTWIRQKVRHAVKTFAMPSKIRHAVKQFVMKSESLSCRQKVRHDGKRFVKQFVMTAQRASWRHKVRHYVKKNVMTWKVTELWHFKVIADGHTDTQTDNLNTIVSQPFHGSTKSPPNPRVEHTYQFLMSAPGVSPWSWLQTKLIVHRKQQFYNVKRKWAYT